MRRKSDRLLEGAIAVFHAVQRHIMNELEEQPDQSTMERRTAVRYICKLKAACIQGATGQFKPLKFARVNDISAGGLGLHLSEQFAVGTQLTVRLHARTGDPLSALMEVRVAHASEQIDGTWFLGVAFIEPLSEAAVHALLQK
jgi:hypothetical protein